MTIEHDDDLLLTSIAAGSPPPQGDPLAGLLAAWHADLSAEPVPVPALRPATERDRPPLPVPLPTRRRLFRRTSATANPAPGRRWVPRPAVVAVVAAALAFGGLTFASATATPGSPLWPITRVIFGDTAKNRLAAQEATKLLDQARAAATAGDRIRAAQLVEQARAQIGQITDSEVRQRLTGEADALWEQIRQMPLTVGPAGTPLPGQTGLPGTPNPSPPASGGGILPPLPTISLPTLLPSGILPDLPPLPLIG